MCYEVRRCISVIDPRFSVTDRRIKIPKDSAGLAVDFFFPKYTLGDEPHKTLEKSVWSCKVGMMHWM